MPASCQQKEWPQPQALDLHAHNRDNSLMVFTGPDRLSIGRAGLIGWDACALDFGRLSKDQGFIDILMERRKTSGKCLLPLPFI